MTKQPKAIRMIVDMQCARCKGVGVELIALLPDAQWRILPEDHPHVGRYEHEMYVDRLPVEARCLSCNRTMKFGPVGTATA